ncbi:MAG: glycosyltransferase family 4 protein [Bacilli bacterium]|nr:glycosyltransferase family 4 protein [Bacilli bacterium]
MRIGIFTDTYPPYINGVSTSIVMLQRALEKKGHEVFIVTVNADTMSYKYENEDKVIRIPGIPIGIFDYRLTGIYPLRAIEKIRKWNLDVIHSHTEFGVGTFARIIAKQFDIPIVHTYHTMYEDYVHYITKGYFNGTSKKIVEYLTKFYCDKTATELIVPTKKTYDLFKQKYHVERNIHIIPTGIEVERFYIENYKKEKTDALKKSLGFDKEDFIILFVGRMGKEKSVDFLIEMQKDIYKKNPNAKMLMIGDGPYLENFKKLTSKLKLDNAIKFLGKIPWDDIPKYYALADTFVTASKTETQGLTVIEAMAASIPVVAIEDESFSSVIVDDLNGRIFKNKRQYKTFIEELIQDPAKRLKMGKQARISAETHSSKYFAEQVLDVYKKALGEEGLQPKPQTFLGRLKAQIKKGLPWKTK